MHGCGHDGHLAMADACMHILSRHKDSWRGRVLFLFEEAEETSCGVFAMVEALRSFQPDAIYGCHVKGDLESGKISCQEGPVMAALKAVEFTIHGQGGHGSRPDLAANPLFAGTAILNDIAIAWANQVDVRETVTLGITKFQCGEALNVISDHAEIGGTLRYFNQAAGEAAYETLMNIARNVAQVHKCRVEEKPNGA